MTELEGQISLSDYLDRAEPVPEPEDDPNYSVPDDAQATQLLRTLSSVEKQIAAVSSMAEHERAKITAWEAQTNEPLQRKALWLRNILEGYAIYQRDEFGRKTINLPHGTLATRPAQLQWKITDKDAFVEWAEANGVADLVRIKKEPQMTVIKNAFQPEEDGTIVDIFSGEAVPGIEAKPSDTPYTASVKPS